MTATQINPMKDQHESARQIMITLRHNTDTHHWSVEIDGERYEDVTTDVIEALVECQLVIAEKWLTDWPCPGKRRFPIYAKRDTPTNPS